MGSLSPAFTALFFYPLIRHTGLVCNSALASCSIHSGSFQTLTQVKLPSVRQGFSQTACQADTSPVLFGSFVHRGYPYFTVAFGSTVVTQTLILQKERKLNGGLTEVTHFQRIERPSSALYHFEETGDSPGFRWISDTDLFLAMSHYLS